jgi:hypothetical protein
MWLNVCEEMGVVTLLNRDKINNAKTHFILDVSGKEEV